MVSVEEERSGLVVYVSEEEIVARCASWLKGSSSKIGDSLHLSYNDADLGVTETGDAAVALTSSEQLQNQKSGFLHPFAKGIRRQVHNLQTFLQHRPVRSTTA